ncbi:MAG: hypothetical protein ACYSUY_01330, partial [Planctomycetota bacterium]
MGMILLSFIATRARNIEALSVPEIIGRQFGNTARLLAVIALVIAYMVIVSYQFNAGGMVLEVITGKKEKVALGLENKLTKNHVRKGYFHYEPPQDWTGTTEIKFNVQEKGSDQWSQTPEVFTVKVVKSTEIVSEKAQTSGLKNISVIKENTFTRVIIEGYDDGFKKHDGIYRLAAIPQEGKLFLHEPVLTAQTATIIAAIFIVAYTMLAGLMSLAFADIVTGIIITVTLLIAFPVLLIKAGGFAGMMTSFTAMGDRPEHMKLIGVFSAADYINFM